MASMSAAQNRTPAGIALPQTEINWDRLDKTKFFVVGAGLFSGVSALLYPVSVLKTRMQVARADAVHTTALSIFKHVLRSEGIPGLYRGFGLIITGTIPSRMVFLTTLETTKAATLKLTEKLDVPETSAAAIANGLAGLVSSMASQTVFVPLDVVGLHVLYCSMHMLRFISVQCSLSLAKVVVVSSDFHCCVAPLNTGKSETNGARHTGSHQI
jgi:solute carrier family 25 protein 44